ncbi:MAG: glyoxylate/hydroxypyruvate reductase A [Pseudomonadota bacterium]
MNNNGYGNEAWRKELSTQAPEYIVREFGEQIDPDEIDYALVWNHPKEDLLNYPNLKAVFSLGAGAEHFTGETELPDVPIVLLSDPAVAKDMAAYALYWILMFHRKFRVYEEQQTDAIWYRHSIVPTSDFKVGILGLGKIGTEIATRISDFGYSVSGWDRKRCELPGIENFEGEQSIGSFLGANDVIINCLPLTNDTCGFMNSDRFNQMRKGARFLNLSRGAIIVEEDLLGSIDNGHIAGATLDAFTCEPLAPDHRFWHHPNINVTPHMSGATFASSALRLIVENIHRIEKGEPAFPLFDRTLGY